MSAGALRPLIATLNSSVGLADRTLLPSHDEINRLPELLKTSPSFCPCGSFCTEVFSPLSLTQYSSPLPNVVTHTPPSVASRPLGPPNLTPEISFFTLSLVDKR